MTLTKQDTLARYNLTLPQKTKDLVDQLQTRTGSTSMAEVVRRALALLDAVIEQQAQGGTVLVRWPDGTHSKLIIL